MIVLPAILSRKAKDNLWYSSYGPVPNAPWPEMFQVEGYWAPFSGEGSKNTCSSAPSCCPDILEPKTDQLLGIGLWLSACAFNFRLALYVCYDDADCKCHMAGTVTVRADCCSLLKKVGKLTEKKVSSSCTEVPRLLL